MHKVDTSELIDRLLQVVSIVTVTFCLVHIHINDQKLNSSEYCELKDHAIINYYYDISID